MALQAVFEGDVDASTVKHRLDVLHELQLPVYITAFEIRNLDPAKHAYELEKFLRIAFSHDAVAGISLGDLWDTSSSDPKHGSGLYAANKQPKPSANKLSRLWKEEWHTVATKSLGSDGTIMFDGYYGSYTYSLTAYDQVCSGSINLESAEVFDYTPGSMWGRHGADADPQEFIIQCEWEGHVHIPVRQLLAHEKIDNDWRVRVSCALGVLPPCTQYRFGRHPRCSWPYY